MNKCFRKFVSALSAAALLVMPMAGMTAANDDIKYNGVLQKGAWAGPEGNSKMNMQLGGVLTYNTAKSRYEGTSDFSNGVATPDGSAGFESPDGESSAWLIAPYNRINDGVDKGARNDHGFGLIIDDALYTGSDGTPTESEYSLYVEYWGERQKPLTLQYLYQDTTTGTLLQRVKTVQIPIQTGTAAEWRTARIDLNDAWFAKVRTESWVQDATKNSGFHGKSQLALKSNGEIAYIRRVAVVTQDDATDLNNPDNIFEPVNNVAVVKPNNSVVFDGEPQITTAGSNRTVTVNLKNIDFKAGKVQLVAYASRTEDGAKVGASAVDSVNVSKAVKTATLTATVEVPDGCELKYFVVDGNGASLRNMAPGEITSIEAQSTMKGVIISWQAPEDDFGCEYVVYKNGNELLRTTESSYKDMTARNGDKYTVMAVDHEGLETPMSASVQSEGFYTPSYVNCGDPSDRLGCKLNDNTTNYGADGYIQRTEIDGVACSTTIDRSTIADATNKNPTFLYVASNKEDVDSSVKNVTIIVDYYDDGNGQLVMQYITNSAAKTTGTKFVNLTGGGWKTVMFQVTDADFTAPTWLTNSDVRFSNPGGTKQIAISKVTIMPTACYDE